MSSVVKRSLSFPPALLRAVEAEARAAGVAFSTVMADAARHWLIVRQGLRAVAEWEAEHGALTRTELNAADSMLDAATAESALAATISPEP